MTLRLLLAVLLLALVAPTGCDGNASLDHDAAPGDDPEQDAAPPPPPTEVLAVCASGGAEFTTIAAAIAAARAGAAIEICPGTYHERLSIMGKPLHLIGSAGAATTIIDGGGAGTALTIQATKGTGVIVEGLTLANGNSSGSGGGIRCEASTLRLIGCALTANRAKSGGGLYASSCALDIESTRFAQNAGGEQGGGALMVGSSGEVRKSEFVKNQAALGGGLAVVEGSVAVLSNQFRGNSAGTRGGALYHESDALVAGNNIAENASGWTGGGIQVVKHAPVLRDNTISANTSVNDGGGIYVHQSKAVLRNNHVIGNQSGDDGGGIRIFESSARLEANLVENNLADSGAGIRVSHVQSQLIDNVVRNNQAVTTGGGMDLDNDSSVVRGGEISGNKASKGGGIFMWLAPWNGATIENVLIARNEAWRGGGIHLDDNFQHVELRGLKVVDNIADQGGGLYVRATDFTLSHSVFIGNQGNGEGGGLYIGANGHWWDPCPCPPTSPHGRVEFVVVYANVASTGAALWTSFGDLTVQDSIFYKNSGTQVTAAGAPDTPRKVMVPVWRFNDTLPASFSDMTDPTGQNGNLAQEPLFVGAAAGDFHLSNGSPCVDAADPALHDGNGTRADMGSYGGTL